MSGPPVASTTGAASAGSTSVIQRWKARFSAASERSTRRMIACRRLVPPGRKTRAVRFRRVTASSRRRAGRPSLSALVTRVILGMAASIMAGTAGPSIMGPMGTPAAPGLPVTDIGPPGRFSAVRLGDLWAYLALAFFLAPRDAKVRHKPALIGVALAVLQPVVMMA